jgi:hypothetical protein
LWGSDVCNGSNHHTVIFSIVSAGYREQECKADRLRDGTDNTINADNAHNAHNADNADKAGNADNADNTVNDNENANDTELIDQVVSILTGVVGTHEACVGRTN